MNWKERRSFCIYVFFPCYTLYWHPVRILWPWLVQPGMYLPLLFVEHLSIASQLMPDGIFIMPDIIFFSSAANNNNNRCACMEVEWKIWAEGSAWILNKLNLNWVRESRCLLFLVRNSHTRRIQYVFRDVLDEFLRMTHFGSRSNFYQFIQFFFSFYFCIYLRFNY